MSLISAGSILLDSTFKQRLREEWKSKGIHVQWWHWKNRGDGGMPVLEEKKGVLELRTNEDA
jgi:hypothetical protein